MFHGFELILEAKLNQVGMENRAKIDQKTHGKYTEKKKASWRRLGGVLDHLGVLNIHGTRWTRWRRGSVAGTQEPLLRIP